MARFVALAVAAVSALLAGGALAQTVPDIGFKSVGRAAPLAAAIPSIAEPPAAASPQGGPPPFLQAVVAVLQQGAVVGPLKLAVPGPEGKKIELFSVGDAWGGDVPKGVKPLPIDIFTSTDFYKDRALWTDPRYFRCNSPLSLEVQWGRTFGRTFAGDHR